MLYIKDSKSCLSGTFEGRRFTGNGRDKSAPGRGRMDFVLYVNRVVTIYKGNMNQEDTIDEENINH
jgi:hypothetical protein